MRGSPSKDKKVKNATPGEKGRWGWKRGERKTKTDGKPMKREARLSRPKETSTVCRLGRRSATKSNSALGERVSGSAEILRTRRTAVRSNGRHRPSEHAKLQKPMSSAHQSQITSGKHLPQAVVSGRLSQ